MAAQPLPARAYPPDTPAPVSCIPRIPASNAHCTLRARCRCSRSTSTSRRSTTAAAFPPRTGWCCTAPALLGSAYYGPTHHGSLHHGPLALFTKVLHGLDGRLEPPLMLPTPLGAVALLWADEHGRACFHTAGDLSAGARVVLNSFWQTPRSPSPPAEAPRDALPRREVPGAAYPNPTLTLTLALTLTLTLALTLTLTLTLALALTLTLTLALTLSRC